MSYKFGYHWVLQKTFSLPVTHFEKVSKVSVNMAEWASPAQSKLPLQ